MRRKELILDPNRLGAMYPSRLSISFCLLESLREYKIEELDPAQRPGYKLAKNKSVYYFYYFEQKRQNNKHLAFILAKKALNNKEYKLAKSKAFTPLEKFEFIIARGDSKLNIKQDQKLKKLLKDEENGAALARSSYLYELVFLELSKDFCAFGLDFNSAFFTLLCLYLLRELSIKTLLLNKEFKNSKQLAKIGLRVRLDLDDFKVMIQRPMALDFLLYKREKALDELKALSLNKDEFFDFYRILEKARQWLLACEHDDLKALHMCELACIQLENYMSKLLVSELTLVEDLLNLSLDFSLELQELIFTCLLELCQNIAKKYTKNLEFKRKDPGFDGSNLAKIQELLEANYHFAINTDFSLEYNEHFYYYEKNTKLCRRLRTLKKYPELELDIARKANKLYHCILKQKPKLSVQGFLKTHPEYKSIIKRVLCSQHLHLGELAINVLAQDFLPLHLLRAKLALLGATSYDPLKDEMANTVFFGGCPFIKDLNEEYSIFNINQKNTKTQQHNFLMNTKELLALYKELLNDKQLALKVLELQLVYENATGLLLDAMKNKTAFKLAKQTDSKSVLELDLKDASLLFFMKELMNKAIKGKYKKLIIKNSKNRSFIYSELKQVNEKGISTHTSFRNIHLFWDAKQAFPNLYQGYGKDENLSIEFDANEPFRPKAGFLLTHSAIDYARAHEQGCKLGVRIKNDEWQKLKKLIAKKSLKRPL